VCQVGQSENELEQSEDSSKANDRLALNSFKNLSSYNQVSRSGGNDADDVVDRSNVEGKQKSKSIVALFKV
jgi:hypothetical protein